MNTFSKCLLLLACLPASVFAADTFSVSAQIDGYSRLVVKPDQLYWQHFLYARPGRHLTNLPTMLNSYAWYPKWPDSNDSSPALSFPLVLIAVPLTNTIELVKESGRGSVTVAQQPNADNGYTLMVDFNDPADGPDRYSIVVSGCSLVLPPLLTAQVASVALSWDTETNRSYQLQYSTSLAPNTWFDVAPPILGYGTNASFIDSVLAQPRRFYRVVAIQ